MLNPVQISRVSIRDTFWDRRIQTAKEISVPYMYHLFNGERKETPRSYSLDNLRRAAGKQSGEFEGPIFQDSDLYKYIEAVGYYLAQDKDATVEENCDSIIRLICEAQMEDGYINTYYMLTDISRRWTRLASDHELYCAGHLMEAACAYYLGTGKRELLDAACRFADCIDRTFGREDGKFRGYPGHQEIEIGLLRLYEVTGESRYLSLCEYFLNERGREPFYFDTEWEREKQLGRIEESEPHWSHFGKRFSYMQAHQCPWEQTEAIGHAVRANYMYTAMAHLAGIKNDARMLRAAERIFDDIVQKHLYITGGVGSMILGEAYSLGYDLPNDIMYCETCASVALAMYGMHMANITKDSKYADVVEQALYNTILGSIQLDGTRFFYINPMSVWRDRCLSRPDFDQVKPERQEWYDCACCPPNVLRTILGLGQYIYSSGGEEIYVHQFIASSAVFSMAGGDVTVAQTSRYPWDGRIQITLTSGTPQHVRLGVRIPGWCGEYRIAAGNPAARINATLQKGYAIMDCDLQGSVTITLELEMPAQVVRANSNVPATAGQFALRRGPIVYCLEEADNVHCLWNLCMDTRTTIREEYREDLLDGIVQLDTEGFEAVSKPGDDLYSTDELILRPHTLTWIPYYAWCNREPGNMQVWTREITRR